VGHRLADGPFELAAAPDRSRFLAALEARPTAQTPCATIAVASGAGARAPVPAPADDDEEVIIIDDEDILMRAEPKLLTGLNTYWIRFFVLAVFATMYVRDHARPALHKALGLDPDEYDRQVLAITSEITKQVFPVTLALDDPRFYAGLDRLAALGAVADAAQRRGGLGGALVRASVAVRAAFVFARLYFLPTRSHALPERVRMAPAW
jgi:hypothetical protein